MTRSLKNQKNKINLVKQKLCSMSMNTKTKMYNQKQSNGMQEESTEEHWKQGNTEERFREVKLE